MGSTEIFYARYRDKSDLFDFWPHCHGNVGKDRKTMVNSIKNGFIQTCDYACPHIFGFIKIFVKTYTFVDRAANSKKHLLISMKIKIY